MKKIKFRAWDKTMSMMIYQNDIEFEFRLTGKGIEVDDLTFVDTAFNEKHEDIDCEVMQYTGLKDKNGVEIYEGDLFRLEFDNGEYLCSVEFCEEEVAYVLIPKKTFKEKYGKLLWIRGNEDFNNNEILGNVYENPELLEQII